MRTVTTAGAPPGTFIHAEISAMSGNRPNIVQRPYHRAAPFLQPLEKKRIVKVIAVDIMEMHNVRLQFIELLDEPFGG